MRNVKSILLNYFNLSKEEYELFTLWAIGNNSDAQPSKIPEIWNKLHGDLFEISGSCEMLTCIERMIAAWRADL